MSIPMLLLAAAVVAAVLAAAALPLAGVTGWLDSRPFDRALVRELLRTRRGLRQVARFIGLTELAVLTGVALGAALACL